MYFSLNSSEIKLNLIRSIQACSALSILFKIFNCCFFSGFNVVKALIKSDFFNLCFLPFRFKAVSSPLPNRYLRYRKIHIRRVCHRYRQLTPGFNNVAGFHTNIVGIAVKRIGEWHHRGTVGMQDDLCGCCDVGR